MRRQVDKNRAPSPAPIPSPRHKPGGPPSGSPFGKPGIQITSSSPRPSIPNIKAQKGGKPPASWTMARAPSKDLINQLSGSTVFTTEEIQRLGRRFRKLDSDLSGTLTMDEFLQLPEIRSNPLAQRVVQTFDNDGNGVVDFREFVLGMSQFNVKGNQEARLRFAFRIYDMDNDGKISNGELFQVLKMMTGENLQDIQLQQLVDHTILLANKDGHGNSINFQQFSHLVQHGTGASVHKNMIINGV